MISRVVNRLTLVLIAVCVGLGAIIAWELRDGATAAEAQPEKPPGGVDTARSPAGALPELSPATGLQAYREVLERPLFVKGRQPPAKPQPVVVPEQVRPMRYVLEGIAIAGDRRVALLHDPGSRERVSLEEGNVWQGWLVQRVLPDKVILSADGQSRELTLEPEEATNSTSKGRR